MVKNAHDIVYEPITITYILNKFSGWSIDNKLPE